MPRLKKVLTIAAILAVLGGLALTARIPAGLGLSTLVGMLDEDKQKLIEQARAFLEAIQYKDFEKAASFHNEIDRAKADIPALIERLFKVKPELLNIRDLQVTGVDIDSTGTRARTFFNTNIEFLNSLRNPKDDPDRKQRDTEGVLYWQKNEAGTWDLKLESSLR